MARIPVRIIHTSSEVLAMAKSRFKRSRMIVSEQEALEYLQGQIKYWQSKHSQARNAKDRVVAGSYLDAYQSAKANIFGGELPSTPPADEQAEQQSAEDTNGQSAPDLDREV